MGVLKDEYPELYKQIDHNKNSDLLALSTVTSASHKKVWWLCDKGHSYQQFIYNRTRKNGQGCPYCSGKSILKGFNDLKTLCPHIAYEWDYDKNDKTPEEISKGSNKKVWWLCDKGHSYQSIVKNRTQKNSGCPYCSGHKVLAGFNDLYTTHPNIIKQWDKLINNKNGISYKEVSAGSHKQAWWVCDQGHSYKMDISQKIRRPNSCPVCSGYKVITGVNDIYTQNKKLREIWSDKNTEDIKKVLHTSTKSYIWCCDKGHEWETSPSSLSRDNVNCPYCSGHRVYTGFNDIKTTHPNLLDEWDFDKNSLNPEEISKGSNKSVWWLCNKGHSYKAKVAKRTAKINPTGCPQCSRNISMQEKELVKTISDYYNKEIINNSREIIPPLELDIYLPDLKIAIEYNGLYWHSEAQGKTKRVHYNKWKSCLDNNIQLITIWEDDWINNKQVVKNILLHKLGISNQDKIYARKTYVDFIDKKQAREFCDANHIQGFASGSVYIALRAIKTQELVAVAIYKKNGSEARLERYCTSSRVIGGMGKLLKAGTTWAQENSLDKIVTFSDHEVSDGNLYEKLGFTQDKELSPDYKYVYKGKRIHKFNFRLKRFKNDPELQYDSSLTEKELALLNNIPRVWDCGKTRWIIKV